MPSEPDAPLVLVVEDDEAVAAAERDILNDEGYRVAIRPGADVEAVASMQPALVVLDIVIDGAARGWDLLRGLKTDPATTPIPVLVVTAASSREIAAAGSILDAWDCPVLTKPFDIDEFVAAVRTRLLSVHAPESASSPANHLDEGAIDARAMETC